MPESNGLSVRVVLTTAPSTDVAEGLGATIVAERLAACATVVPGITSIYRWEGEVRHEGEVLVILKTTESCVERLRARLVDLHPYDVPEVVAMKVEAGHEPYLSWVRSEVAST
jgi:periplasmic divalent cation tolerance protein